MFYCEICSDWMDCWNDCENCEVWREEYGKDTDKPERGQRAEMEVYDDACSFTDEEMKLYCEMLSKDSVDTGINIFDDRLWIEGDDGVEMVVPSYGLLHDKATIERYNKIVDELNSLGNTSFTITSEQIKSLLKEKDDD